MYKQYAAGRPGSATPCRRRHSACVLRARRHSRFAHPETPAVVSLAAAVHLLISLQGAPAISATVTEDVEETQAANDPPQVLVQNSSTAPSLTPEQEGLLSGLWASVTEAVAPPVTPDPPRATSAASSSSSAPEALGVMTSSIVPPVNNAVTAAAAAIQSSTSALTSQLPAAAEAEREQLSSTLGDLGNLAAQLPSAAEGPAQAASPLGPIDLQQPLQKVEESLASTASAVQSAGSGLLQSVSERVQLPQVAGEGGGPGAVDPVLAGAGVACLGLTLALASTLNQRSKLQKENADLLSDKTSLESSITSLDENVAKLRAELSGETQALKQSTSRAASLQKQLKESISSLDKVSTEKQLTLAQLADTKNDLEKERKAGTALGEQVVDLSSQLKEQTKRAEGAEAEGDRLQRELDEKINTLKEQVLASAKLENQLSEKRGIITRMEADAEVEANKLAEKIKEADKFSKRATSLRSQLDDTQMDLKKAYGALEAQQVANSELRADNEHLESRVAKLTDALNDTTSRLATETDVASEMKSQLAELKLEYIAAGDKLEAEQNTIRHLQSDLRNMEHMLSSVSHDKKTAQMASAQLSSQLEDMEKKVVASEGAKEKAESRLAAAEAEVARLTKSLVNTETELSASQRTAQSKNEALQKEQQARQALEKDIAELMKQLEAIRATERSAREQAQTAMADLRRDLESFRHKARQAKSGGAGNQARLSAARKVVPSAVELKDAQTQVMTPEPEVVKKQKAVVQTSAREGSSSGKGVGQSR